MRDFRDAKAMAHTLRSTLATQGHKITNSQSLELIARAFGAADWNTLSAAIRAEPKESSKVELPVLTAGQMFASSVVVPSAELDATLGRAMSYANRYKHQYATIEHLLLALIDDGDASSVLKACGADLGALQQGLAEYVENRLNILVRDDDGPTARPTAGFQRSVQRGHEYRKRLALGRSPVTGAEVLLGIFGESLSPAARLLGEQRVDREAVMHAVVGRKGEAGRDATL
jgi:hypothetical protein